MRYIFLVMMFVSVLFSAQQRQIIIGSFSIESNALFYSLAVQKQINADEELKNLMQKYSLTVEYKKIGDYNVVSISSFADYPALFETIAVVKKQFPEAYAIKFPAFSSMVHEKQMPQMHEEVVEEKIDAQEDFQEDEATQEESLVQEVEAMDNVDDEPLGVPEAEPTVEEEMQMPILIADVESDSYDEIMLMLLLLLVVIAYILYKVKAKKKEPLED